jgi:hypothetical protein
MTDLLLLSTPLAKRELPGGVCPSLSNITLASYLRAQGVSVDVFDPSVDLDDATLDDAAGLLDRIVEEIERRDPKIVGVSCLSTQEGRFGVAVAQRLRKRGDRPVVLGGIWATATAEDIVARFPEVTGVIRGPGELAALAMIREGVDHPERIPGWTWLDADGAVQRNKEAIQVANPPAIDASLMAHPEAYDIFPWLSSRGCPFHCAFCTEKITSPDFALHPDAKVDCDLTALTEVGPNWYLWICDPLFGLPDDRVNWLCARLEKTPHEWLAESRVDVLKPSDIPKMRAAGCNMIYFGLEAVTEPALRELDKIGSGPNRLKRYLDGATAVVTACLENDVLPVLGVLQPVPGDTPEHLAEALVFLKSLAALPAQVGVDLAPCFHAFPLRFDRGSPYESQEARLTALGVTFTPTDDPLFGDRYLHDASAKTSAEAAEAFRVEVRALNSSAPHIMQRLMRSFPRPYVQFEV